MATGLQAMLVDWAGQAAPFHCCIVLLFVRIKLHVFKV
jgi:hypothetical protein